MRARQSWRRTRRCGRWSRTAPFYHDSLDPQLRMRAAMRMASRGEWDLSKLPDAARRERLLSPPSAESLLARLIGEAERAVERCAIHPKWIEACTRPGYFRLEAQIPVSE